jgi:uncharacterized protein YyaL (SSP411 family)
MRVLLLCFLLYLGATTDAENSEKSLDEWWQVRKNWLVSHQVIEANKTPLYINQLIKQDSPYLLSHSLQPVDWFSWGSTPLSLAKTYNKLIYLSVGYQTCHWCHVLAQESYVDLEIASQLNQDFISIKVDKETHPELDQKYRRALENMTGNAGWPIQVVLTPDGNILWIDSYTTRPQLTKTLGILAGKWGTNPQAMQNLAHMQQQQLLPKQNMPKANSSRSAIDQQYKSTLTDARELLLQEQQGTGPRFLRANWLLLLLDEYLLNADKADLELVTTQISQLLTSPSYDFIEGGMHRYAEDDHWQRPHYEKMLYDQALLIQVLSRLTLITQDNKYIQFAFQTISFVNKFLKTEMGYASSISALSGDLEGAYYQFDLDNEATSQYWNASAAENGQLLYLNTLSLPSDDQLAKLVGARQQHLRPLQDEKSVLAWNALYLSSLIELYQVTADQQVRATATELANQLMQHFYNESGLFRIVFAKRTTIEATVEDYAYLIVALNQAYWTFQDTAYFEFVKQITPAFIARVRSTLWQNLLTDLQLNSAAAVTLKALQQIAEFYDPRHFRKELNGYQSNIDVMSLSLSSLSLINISNSSETNRFKPVQPFAQGKAIARVIYNNGAAVVQIDLSPGWHINSNQPMDTSLIATKLSMPGNISVVTAQYPTPTIKPLGFSQQLLSLYEGRIYIPFSIVKLKAIPRIIKLQVQACSEKMCLLPENINLIF